MPRALMREAKVVDFIPSKAAAPSGPKNFPPVWARAAAYSTAFCNSRTLAGCDIGELRQFSVHAFGGDTNEMLGQVWDVFTTQIGQTECDLRIPLDRTMETASIQAAPHRLEVQPRDGLREISHGRWEGMTRTEVLNTYPEDVAAWDEDPSTFAPAGGESGLAVAARALPPLMDICAVHRGEHVAIISHKATIRLVISSMLGFDPRRYRDNLDQSPCALNIVYVRGPTCFRRTLFNDTSPTSSAKAMCRPCQRSACRVIGNHDLPKIL